MSGNPVSVARHPRPDNFQQVDLTRRVVRLKPGDDLNTAITALAPTLADPGVIELTPGSYASFEGEDTALVSGLTIRGIGDGRATIDSKFTCAGATQVFLDRFEIRPIWSNRSLLTITGTSQITIRDMVFAVGTSRNAATSAISHEAGAATISFEGEVVASGDGLTADRGLLELTSGDGGTYFQKGSLTVQNDDYNAEGATGRQACTIHLEDPTFLRFDGTTTLFGRMYLQGVAGTVDTSLSFHEITSHQGTTATPPIVLGNIRNYHLKVGHINAIRDDALGDGLGIVTAYSTEAIPDPPTTSLETTFGGDASVTSLNIGKSFVPNPGSYAAHDSNLRDSYQLDDSTIANDEVMITSTGFASMGTYGTVLTSANSTLIRGQHSAGTAVHLDASDNAGGVRVTANSNGVDVDTIRGGPFSVLTNVTAAEGSGALTLETTSDAALVSGNITIASTGVTPSNAGTITMSTTNETEAADGSGSILVTSNGGISTKAKKKVWIASDATDSDSIRVQTDGGIDIDANSASQGINIDAAATISDAIRLRASGVHADTNIHLESLGTGEATNEAGSIYVEAVGGGIGLNATKKIYLDSASTDDQAIRVEAPSGGIDIDAATRIVMQSVGNVNDAVNIRADTGANNRIWVYNVNSANSGAIRLEANAGGIEFNAATTLALTSGQLHLEGTDNDRAAANTGAINGAVEISATTGGVAVNAEKNVYIEANETAAANAGAAIFLHAKRGEAVVRSDATVPDAIHILANGGTNATTSIRIQNADGTAGATLTPGGGDPSGAIELDATTGGIRAAAAANVIIDASGATDPDAIHILADGNAGGVLIQSAPAVDGNASSTVVVESRAADDGNSGAVILRSIANDDGAGNAGDSSTVLVVSEVSEGNAGNVIMRSTATGAGNAGNAELASQTTTGNAGVVSVTTNSTGGGDNGGISISENVTSGLGGGIEIKTNATTGNSGGIEIKTNATNATGNSGNISITTAANTAANCGKINLTSGSSQNATADNGAILLDATAGGICLDAGEAIFASANTGRVTLESAMATGATATDGAILLDATAGGICLDSAEAIYLDSETGHISIDAGDNLILQAADDITLTANNSSTSAITIRADGTAGAILMASYPQSNDLNAGNVTVESRATGTGNGGNVTFQSISATGNAGSVLIGSAASGAGGNTGSVGISNTVTTGLAGTILITSSATGAGGTSGDINIKTSASNATGNGSNITISTVANNAANAGQIQINVGNVGGITLSHSNTGSDGDFIVTATNAGSIRMQSTNGAGANIGGIELIADAGNNGFVRANAFGSGSELVSTLADRTLLGVESGSVLEVSTNGAATTVTLPGLQVGLEYTIVLHENTDDNLIIRSESSGEDWLGTVHFSNSGSDADSGTRFAGHDKVTIPTGMLAGSWIKFKCYNDNGGRNSWFVSGQTTGPTEATPGSI